MAEISTGETDQGFESAKELSQMTEKVAADDAATAELSYNTTSVDFAVDRDQVALEQRALDKRAAEGEVRRDSSAANLNDDPAVVEAARVAAVTEAEQARHFEKNQDAILRAREVHEAALKDNRQVEYAAKIGIDRQAAATDPAIRGEMAALDQAGRQVAESARGDEAALAAAREALQRVQESVAKPEDGSKAA